MWSLLTWALPVGSVPEQISLAADSHFKVFDQVRKLERKQPIGSNWSQLDQVSNNVSVLIFAALSKSSDSPLKFHVDERVLWIH